MLSDDRHYTLPVALANLAGEHVQYVELMMGGAVVILFFLPWLDNSPVKSIRYRPSWHKVLYGIFVVFFAVLGYLGIGILIGPSALGLVEKTPRVETASEMGVLFLLFTIILLFEFTAYFTEPNRRKIKIQVHKPQCL